MSIVMQLLAAAIPLGTGLLIDRVVPRRDYSLLLTLTALYASAQLFSALSGFVRDHLVMHLRVQLEARLTFRFLDHLITLPYAFFQQRTAGDLMIRLGSQAAIRDILTSTLVSTLLDGLMTSLYLVLLTLASVRVTLVVLALAAGRLLLLALMRWRQRQFLSEHIDIQARSQTAQIEMLGGMETLKAMGLESRAADQWSRVFVDGLNLSVRRGRLDALFGAAMNGMGAVSTLLLMFYGTFLVLEGTWTLGTMMAYSALAGGLLAPLSSLVGSALQWQMLEIYLERLNDVMDTPAEAGTSVSPSTAPGMNAATRTASSRFPVPPVATVPLTGALALDGLSFRYPSQSAIVLDGVSVHIEAGAHVALVGRTGSGKSTLARLMAGLYEPSAGRVLFDGRDLRQLDRRIVRSQLGIVTQETQLFGGTIRDNIALSDPDMPADRVVNAAKLACIHDDIIAMPMGYDTALIDRGLSLSGGQRQRLALARALACQPKILVLDEANSHLDQETERRVKDNLASLHCTVIVIAHRLSTIRDADLILVLDRGKIVQRGTHETLIRLDGVYARMLSPLPPRDVTETFGRPPDKIEYAADRRGLD